MKRIIFSLVLLTLVGCSAAPSQETVQTAISQTQIALTSAAPTAMPSSTPIPTIDTSEKEYLTELEIYLDDYEYAKSGIVDRLDEFLNNPALMFSEEWRNSLNEVLTNLKDSGRSMRLVKAPESCSNVYDNIVDLDKKTRIASDSLEKAFGSMDTTYLDTAISNMDDIKKITNTIHLIITKGKCEN